jgi:hypothetical protein
LEYTSRDVCVDEMRGTIANELNDYKWPLRARLCPAGFDRAQVERCKAAVTEEECSHLLEPLQRIDKCRTAALCSK